MRRPLHQRRAIVRASRSPPIDDETLLSFARWTVDERRCCPFFTFAVEREPTPGALWVRITGPEWAKQILAELE
jgi:hypothetical protein